MWDGFHGLFKRECAANPEIDEREHKRYHTAKGKSRSCLSIGEGNNEVLIGFFAGREVSAGEYQRNYAHDYKHHNGNEQIEYRGLAAGRLLVIVRTFKGALGSGEQIVLDLRIILMLEHKAVVQVHYACYHYHNKRQQAVVVPRNLLYEKLDTVDVGGGYIAGYGGRPRGNRSDHADRRGGSIDYVCKLRAADFVAFGNGAHNGADGEAVEIIVNEDEYAEEHGEKLSGTAGLDGFLRPAAEGFASAALVHQIDHYAKHYQEYDNAHVSGVRQNGYDAVVGANQFYYGVPGVKLSIKQRAYKAA